MEPIAQSVARLVEAGCDIVWLPMPTLGGTCMSKKHYVELCLPYNKQFIEKIRKTGAKIIYILVAIGMTDLMLQAKKERMLCMCLKRI